MSPRRNHWDSPKPCLASEWAPPLKPKGGGHTCLRVRDWGSPSSDDLRKSLALCLLCGALWIPGLLSTSPHLSSSNLSALKRRILELDESRVVKSSPDSPSLKQIDMDKAGRAIWWTVLEAVDIFSRCRKIRDFLGTADDGSGELDLLRPELELTAEIGNIELQAVHPSIAVVF